MSDSTVDIQMNDIPLEKIFQTQIDDGGKLALCVAYSTMHIANSILRAHDKSVPKLTLDSINKIVDESVANCGLASKDGFNSDRGWVKSHEKIAEAVGLKGYTKVYEEADASKIFALLQWGSMVELRHEGHHSMIATGWFKGKDEKFYCKVQDPWPYSDDCLLDTSRMVTLKKVNGKLVDSRTIELMGWFKKNGTDWV